MREFIDIITEAVAPKLYHGTSIEALAGILASGTINVSPPDDYDDGHAGVSLTLDPNIANKFADEAKDRDWNNQWNSPVNDGVVLVFDKKDMRSFGKMVKWDGSNAEAEFRTYGPIPASMIQDIQLDKPSLDWWIDAFEEHGEPHHASALSGLRSRL